MREASKLSNKPHEIAYLFSGSHPSQGDLLEMIDTSANSNLKWFLIFFRAHFPFSADISVKKEAGRFYIDS